MSPADLIAFEARVRDAVVAGDVLGPVHLSGGNEEQLIEVFKDVKVGDWVFSTWRSHYHALLHGLPPEWIFAEILSGRSMSLNSPRHRFLSSAIVGGILPIAMGVAAGIKRQKDARTVWCFVGDMTASLGVFSDCYKYASRNALPIMFVIEDNGLSTTTPTEEAWGSEYGYNLKRYNYTRTEPHIGAA